MADNLNGKGGYDMPWWAALCVGWVAGEALFTLFKLAARLL